MTCTICCILCFWAVGAVGWFQAGPSIKDESRGETTVLARLLLAHPAIRSIAAQRGSRRSELIASVGSDAPRHEKPTVRWMKIDESQAPSKNAKVTTMPFVRLGVAFIPHSDEVLSILEPRYRAMYDDIMGSTSPCFAMSMARGEDECMETAIVFRLSALQKISAQSGETVKYHCQHSLVGRVKLLKVLNPEDALDCDTYLRAEVESIEDTDADVDTSAAEAEVEKLFTDFVWLQNRLREVPRFPDDVSEAVTFKRYTEGAQGKNAGLWGVIALWQAIMKLRVESAASKAQKEIAEARLDLISAGFVTEETLAPKLQVEADRIVRETNADLANSNCKPSGNQILALVQSTSHAERLSMFKYMVDESRRRLETIQSLKALMR